MAITVTAISGHDEPIVPDRANCMLLDGPNQLWVADIPYIAIVTGFVYLAAMVDASSRPHRRVRLSRSVAFPPTKTTPSSSARRSTTATWCGSARSTCFPEAAGASARRSCTHL